MAIRLSGMTLGGKLSLGYVFVATFLWVFGGRSSEWFLMVLGFPLLYAPELVFGDFGRLPTTIGASLLVLLWVGNAYLWGHGIAALIRVVGSGICGATPGPQGAAEQMADVEATNLKPPSRDNTRKRD